ncbi:MAG: hypothetical protein AVDCRST_MAG48-3118, partial [uncultured Friedmanniella sp.]
AARVGLDRGRAAPAPACRFGDHRGV